jgi:hypothetical protein
MFQKLATRIVPMAACGAAILLSASPARSERLGDERACVNAFKKAKEHEGAGKLLEAKELLMSCAQAPCGSFLRQQCSSKYNQLEADTPSVVLIVTDPSGAPRADVQVRMDGQPFTQQLDGRALTVEPGMHEFSFVADGNVFATQKVMIVQGQRNRFITALMRTGGKSKRMVAQADQPASTASKVATPDPRAEEMPAGAARDAADASGDDNGKSDAPAVKKSGSVLPYLLGGVGLASIGAGALLTSWGVKDNDKLGVCSPRCPTAATNHIKRLYLESDIAIGAGLVALGAAYWVYVATHSNKEEKATEEALHLDVVPTTSGGFAGVSGSF